MGDAGGIFDKIAKMGDGNNTYLTKEGVVAAQGGDFGASRPLSLTLFIRKLRTKLILYAVGLFEEIDLDQDGEIRVEEFRAWLKQTHAQKGDKKGTRYINTLFSTFHRKYAKWLEEKVRAAVKSGDMDAAKAYGRQVAEEKVHLETLAAAKARGVLMVEADDVFDKLVKLGGVDEACLTQEDLIAAQGDDFGLFIKIDLDGDGKADISAWRNFLRKELMERGEEGVRRQRIRL